MDRTTTHAASTAQPAEPEPAFLPQYGFGKTFKFDELVDNHPFLYRVHTPRRRDRDRTTSRATSPNPSRPSTPFRPQLSRAPSLSASVNSVRTGIPSPGVDEDDSAPGDPYFISRRFRDDLSSPDVHVRRRTLSTLSTLSGGSDAGTYIGSDYEYDFSDAESDVATAISSTGLTRSSSMMLGPKRRRMDSLTPSRPGTKRSASLGHVSFMLDGKVTPPRPMTPMSVGSENSDSPARPGDMTYEDLQRHLDWTTRSQSPYVTTSFSFFWALWEAVRRYRFGMKHDVEIAVVDARKLRGRAKTALEVLRNVEEAQKDKAYSKWYRFALDTQDVLVFGAIPGDVIYASTPLTQILAALPEYCFRATTELPKSPGPASDNSNDENIKMEIDPRSPTAHQPQQVSFFPVTPDRRSLSGSVISNMSTPSHERERERAKAAELITTLAWDVGTTLKPPRKSKSATKSLSSSTSSASTSNNNSQRFTSHRAFCHALEAAFIAPSRPDAARESDSTVGAVRLATLLISPWLKATCAEGAGLFGEDDSASESESDSEEEAHMHGSECLGLAGDGCALESLHSSVSSAAFPRQRPEKRESKRTAALHEAEDVLESLATALARWPAGWWPSDTEQAASINRSRVETVQTCVGDAASAVKARAGWALANELGRMMRADSENISADAGGEDRRGRGTNRSRSRSRSREPKHERENGLGEEKERAASSKPWPLRRAASSSPSPYKPRARSPLGLAPALLGPAIVLKGKHEGMTSSEPGLQMANGGSGWESSEEDLTSSMSLEERMSLSMPISTPMSSVVLDAPGRERDTSLSELDAWQTHTPPPTPPLGSLSASDSSIGSSASQVNTNSKRSPPPPPPPRSSRRPASPNSLPGEWPEQGVFELQQQQDQVQAQASPLSQPQAETPQRSRTLSWVRQGSGTASPLSGGSRTPSNESLRNASANANSNRLDARTALLGEVLQAALGFGTGTGAGLDTAEAVDVQVPGAASPKRSGSESPGRPTHHRRQSSQLSLQLDQEQALSPVHEEGEAEDEREAALEAALNALEGASADVDTDAKGPSADGNEVEVEPARVSSPPVRDRSSTLESIQEEEWSIIDVPVESVPSLANGDVEYQVESDDSVQANTSSRSAAVYEAEMNAAQSPAPARPMNEQDDQDQETESPSRTLIYTERLVTLSPPPSPRSSPISIAPSMSSTPSTALSTASFAWKRPFLRLLTLLGFRISSSPSWTSSPAVPNGATAVASSPVFEDPCASADVYASFSLNARQGSWAMSCFVVGVMASLLVSSAQRREILFTNTFT